MQELFRIIPKVSRNNSNVLIAGESGTGKELVAAALHNLSPRSEGNFVALNCAAFPEGLLESELFGHMKGSFTGAHQNKEGLFEVANGGTLFLDEVAEMPLNLQSKLLRAIENGTFRRIGGTTDIQVDTRIISATNKDLKREAETGSFREDLFFRLNVIPLRIPPLRERRDDIPLLVEYFIRRYAEGERRFSEDALQVLMDYEWKGNVRELENMVERVLLFSDTPTVGVEDLPTELREHRPPERLLPEIGEGIEMEKLLAEQEKRYLREALKLTGGKKTEAARLLGLTFRSFRHKLSKYGI
jgi:two-component system response regulator PilR (NtrC family)